MSWQRIFELARRQKSPLIITDIAGREPLVVLPLEVYERLIDQRRDGSAPSAAISVPVRSEVLFSGGAPSAVNTHEHQSVSPMVPSSEDDKIRLEEIIAPPVRNYSELPQETRTTVPIDASSEEIGGEDLLLEEKFYLEPLDDEGK